MKELYCKRFVASYSGGKDSVHAAYRAIKAGMEPVGLITMYNTDEQRSWFHGISESMLERAADSMSIPLFLVRTTGEQYLERFEAALSDAKNSGAEVCVFGDIDIEGHLEWCTARCAKSGLAPCFPLLKEDRKKVVYEFVDAGFSAIIKVIDNSCLREEFLGLTLSRAVADEIGKTGADMCGENGEYHTFVYDGPLFSKPVALDVRDKINLGKYTALDVL